MGFDVPTLYELHYQMITLGKVFCLKQRPNCSACPLRHICEYALHKGPHLQAAPAPQPQCGQASAVSAPPLDGNLPQQQTVREAVPGEPIDIEDIRRRPQPVLLTQEQRCAQVELILQLDQQDFAADRDMAATDR